MKTIPTLAFVAAFVAFSLLPFVFEITASVFFTAGVFGLLVLDYTRASRPLRLPARVAVAAAVPVGRSEKFGLAA